MGIAYGQTFDTSATATVQGTYFVRQVLLSNLDKTTSAIGRARSLTGKMIFDGIGGYTFSGQIMDSQVSNPQSYSTSGTYGVSSNGLVQIQNPIDSNDTEFGGVGRAGPSAIVASATEGLYNDFLIAIPAGSGIANGSLQGSYRAGFIDFFQANASQVRDGEFSFTSNGSGSLGVISATGTIANSQVTQTISNVLYNFTDPSGAGNLSVPVSGTPSLVLLSGRKDLFYSADGNIILGGSPDGFDIFFGVKAAGQLSNASVAGTYFSGALENYISDLSKGYNYIDSYYGSVNAASNGAAISHSRFSPFFLEPLDLTLSNGYSINSDGTASLNGLPGYVGANGTIIFFVGAGPYYTLTIGLAAKPVNATGVFLNPYGVVNSASFAPITNPVSPGEYVTLFGSNLSQSRALAQSVPFPTSLGGTQVTVNGRAAPVYFASPTQVSVLVPLETTEGYATFQVMNAGTASNSVTLYASPSAPAFFTLTQDGVGPAAVEHANGSVVTASNPAAAGETLVAFMTGLGSTTPAVPDGTAAASKPLSFVDTNVALAIEDSSGNIYPATVVFQGLSPGFVGLYQVNFVLPHNIPSGQLVFLNVGTSDATASEASLYVK